MIATVVLLILSLSILSLLNSGWLLTAVSMLVYLSAIYLCGWNEGFRDSRKLGDVVPDVPRAVKVALMASVLPVILLIIRVVAYHLCVSSGQQMTLLLRITDVIYKLYNFYFTGFMMSGSLISYIIPIIIMPVVYVVGYVMGTKRIDLSEKFLPKILYKKKEQNR